MPTIRETATVTSKGQITLPKAIRQALGVDVGGKVAFDLIDNRVTVSRATGEPHEDPAIARFLTLLEQDVMSGHHIATLPDELVRSMMTAIGKPIDPHEEIEGDVAV